MRTQIARHKQQYFDNQKRTNRSIKHTDYQAYNHIQQAHTHTQVRTHTQACKHTLVYTHTHPARGVVASDSVLLDTPEFCRVSGGASGDVGRVGAVPPDLVKFDCFEPGREGVLSGSASDAANVQGKCGCNGTVIEVVYTSMI